MELADLARTLRIPVALVVPLVLGCQPTAATEEPAGGAAESAQQAEGKAAPASASAVPVDDIDHSVTQEDRAAAKDLATSGNGFGDALYGTMGGQSGNLFMSPLSVRIALAMTYGGAKGETAAEMATALKLEGSPTAVHGGMAALQESLAEAAGDGQTLTIANRLWGRDGEPFLGEYLQLTREYYGAALEVLDFAGDTEGSRGKINTWISERTAGMIPELIAPGVLDGSTILVLTNAIYFKGSWESKFDPANTQERDFRSPGGAVRAPMMAQTAKFNYGETDDAQVLELPYAGDRLSMVIVLPRGDESLAAIESTMVAEGLSPWLEKTREREVMVSLPRFKFASTMSLNAALQQLGIVKAFGGGDFSGMSGGGGLAISDVIHQAVVEVNEEGTEAAAATAVVMSRSASISRPAKFNADHPFVFAIRDRQSEAVLFVGRLVTPG